MTDRKPTCVACKGAGGGATYTAGTGIVIESNEISADTSVLATKTELANYQPKLTAGTGITISESNIISSTGGTYTILTSTDYVDAGVVEVSEDNNYFTFLKDCILLIKVNAGSSLAYFGKGLKIVKSTKTNLMFDDTYGLIFTSLIKSDLTGGSIAVNVKPAISTFTNDEIYTTDTAGLTNVPKVTSEPSISVTAGAYLYVKE